MILKICDVFQSPMGLVILVVNENLNNIPHQKIKELLIGKNEIHQKDKIVTIDIIDVKIAESMWGGKNIFCLIKDKLAPNDINVGSEIYLK